MVSYSCRFYSLRRKCRRVFWDSRGRGFIGCCNLLLLLRSLHTLLRLHRHQNRYRLRYTQHRHRHLLKLHPPIPTLILILILIHTQPALSSNPSESPPHKKQNRHLISTGAHAKKDSTPSGVSSGRVRKLGNRLRLRLGRNLRIGLLFRGHRKGKLKLKQ